MHASVLDFIRNEVAALNLRDRSVLEVGSLDVNGSPRQFFSGSYLGIDMRPGESVDVVCNAHDLGNGTRFRHQRFDVIVCTEMLEHDDAPWLSLQGMANVCRPGGTLLLTCRGFDRRGCFPLHAYPHDLWRFTCTGVDALLRQTGWTSHTVKADPECPGVFAVAARA